ncbi:hypothetical protein QVA66_09835 [Staphylococcus chromogenes]|nr:hypothetical protein [Staphylococcus chromogenes]
MTSLNDIFTGPRWQRLFADVETYVRSTIQNQSGLTGMAIKGGLKTAEKVKPNAVELGLNHFLPDALKVLSPYWDNRPAGVPFGEHLENNKVEVAEQLMSAADNMAQKVNYPALNKVYGTVRGKAGKVMADNLRGLGEIIERDAG